MKSPDDAAPERVALVALTDRIARLEHHSATILFLSALNMVLNALILIIGFMVSMP